MGFMSRFGFNKPRDAPKILDISDNVRDSGNLFVFGMTHSGERVDERTAMQIVTGLRLRETAFQHDCRTSLPSVPFDLEKVRTRNLRPIHPLYKILYRQPNPEMSSFSFWEALMTHLLLWGNAYAQIVRDGKNDILGLYPLLPENMEIDRDQSGNLFYTYHAYTDEKPGEHDKDIIFQRDEILHIPGLGFNGLVGFSPIAMMKNALGSAIAVERYGNAFFKNGAQPAGVLEHPGVLKNPEQIRDNWTKFTEEQEMHTEFACSKRACRTSRSAYRPKIRSFYPPVNLMWRKSAGCSKYLPIWCRI